MSKDKITIEITKRDKVYLSIILFLVISVVCMAICLPRPYKFIDREVIVKEPVEVRVYEIKKEYVISPTSSLYNSEGCEISGNIYTQSFEESFVDTGKFLSLTVSISFNENGTQTKKQIEIKENLVDLVVFNCSLYYRIKIDSYIMENVKTLFKLNLGNESVGVKDDYLFEFNFEKSQINFLISYISE